ncbi:hypothetical protein Q8A67_004695 [Cirrhinus molitorella]|uniref:Uncharacterized protein n=1 Tax=Cirrhinus molitorella TaxID=172907 RepID=A0AA88Q6P7_9TELE|nr:hypothetical protein Q8A67_004695 [Cirrhinus molitorella]
MPIAKVAGPSTEAKAMEAVTPWPPELCVTPWPPASRICANGCPVPGTAEREQSQPSSSSYCQRQRESVAARAPPPRERGSGRRSRRSADLRTVLLTKRAQAKWPCCCEERVTPQHTVSEPPQRPQGASLIPLPPLVFQGSVGFGERASQLSPILGTTQNCSFPLGEVSPEGWPPH